MPATTELPLGFRLHRTLTGHTDAISQIAWSADGRYLASSSSDLTVRTWDMRTGTTLHVMRSVEAGVSCLAWSPDGKILISGQDNGGIKHWDTNGSLLQAYREHKGLIFRVAWAPDGDFYASASADNTVRLWDAKTARMTRMLRMPSGQALDVAWSRDGKMMAAASSEGSIRIWDAAGERMQRSLTSGNDAVLSLAWSPNNKVLAASSSDRMVRLWDPDTGQLKHVLQGDIEPITCVSFSHCGRIMAGRNLSGALRLWRTDTWQILPGLAETGVTSLFSAGVSWAPQEHTLAVIANEDRDIDIYDVDVGKLRTSAGSTQTVHYTNAKVVLVGDSGAGKTGLGLVLTGHPFTPTESTHGRFVWRFVSDQVELEDGRRENRETLLWDLAGQPGYRLIHQLHLNEVAIALVVFDVRSETDPFSGVRHWDRALRQAQNAAGPDALPLKKFLVAARMDRGNVGVPRERLEAFLQQHDFDGYFETSAREGWGVGDLKRAIMESIDWDSLPKVSSTDLFQRIKDFLLIEKQGGRLLTVEDDLFMSFLRSGQAPMQTPDLIEQFETCIGLVEAQGLIRRLSFGNLILLQPERIDAYASALVNAVRNDPVGMGTMPEDWIYNGKFPMSKDERLPNAEQERLLLIAMVEDLLRHEIALREQGPEGSLLVFPAQSTREYPDVHDPSGTTVVFTFEGPVAHVYATLCVRLSHSGEFERKNMWKNAATYQANSGGSCGILMREMEEGRAELSLFFDDATAEETRFAFEEFIYSHLLKRSLPNTLERRRVFACQECGTPLTETQVRRRRERGFDTIECSVCSAKVSMSDREERVQQSTQPAAVMQMDRAADALRDLEAGLVSAAGEIRMQSFRTWAGGSRSTLAIVFTDIVGSTMMANQIGNESFNQVLRAHYKKGRQVTVEQGGYVIKTIGDSLMVAFRTVSDALAASLSIHENPGAENLLVRAGIHFGPVLIEEEDAFGTMVNFTSRVVESTKDPEVRLSNAAREQLAKEGELDIEAFDWSAHRNCDLRGFEGSYTLWTVNG